MSKVGVDCEKFSSSTISISLNETGSSTAPLTTVKIKLLKKSSKESLLEPIPNPLLAIAKPNSKSDLVKAKTTRNDSESDNSATNVKPVDIVKGMQIESVDDSHSKAETASIDIKEEKSNKKRKKQQKNELDEMVTVKPTKTNSTLPVSEKEKEREKPHACDAPQATSTSVNVKNKKLKLDKGWLTHRQCVIFPGVDFFFGSKKSFQIQTNTWHFWKGFCS